MYKLISVFALGLMLALTVLGQKGVDTQTQKIQQDGTRINSASTAPINPSGSRGFDWGKGKTKVREMLPNPYKLNARRDVLVDNIISVLKDRKIIVDEAASRRKDGFIITQPFVFAKGAVISRNELNRYAFLQDADTSWTRGQYSLTIEIQSIDGVQNNVSVTAKVEGRSGSGLGSEWTTLTSSGVAEDEFLSKLIELMTGTSPDAPEDGN